jgi:terminase, large subunit
VLMLTAGVDVQGDRLEYEIVGWGRDEESWSIEIGILDGDPGQLDVWEELTEKLAAEFEGETGNFRVQCAFIDSGYHAKMVYRYVKRHANRKWYACKGMSDATKPIISKAVWVGDNPKVRMVPVGSTAAKDEIFSNLKVLEPGPGYCHFPTRPEYDDAYLKQLCAEKKVTRFRAGVERKVYEKVSPAARNEALDLRVYATAARVKLNPNYDAIVGNRIRRAEVVDRDEIEVEAKGAAAKVLKFRGSLTKNNPFEGFRP